MFLMFTSDLSPFLADSAASRMLIGIIPAERYVIDPQTSLNLTIQTACWHVVESFNRLSRAGVRIRDNGRIATSLNVQHVSFWLCL